MGFRYDGDPDGLKKLLDEDLAALTEAASLTINEVGQRLKTRGRAEVAAAGFSARFQNALQTKVFPDRPSLDAAAWLFDKIPYAGIFEQGGTIPGLPLLWLPLPTVPLGVGGHPIPPRMYVQKFGALFSIPGAKPLLGANVGGKLVPLYVGKSAVTIGKKFDLDSVVADISAQVPDLFNKNLQV